MSTPEGCKPFDLERALAGDPVVTRDGRPVTQLTHFKDVEYGSESLCGVVCGSLEKWMSDGRYYLAGTSGTDLFMAPKKRTVWVNLYGNGHRGYWYDSEKEADDNSMISRIGSRAWPVEIEE